MIGLGPAMANLSGVKELLDVARRLKGATLSLRAEIGVLDEQLKKAGIDIELWALRALLDEPFFTTGKKPHVEWKAWEVGYAEMGGEFHLVVRRIRCRTNWHVEPEDIFPLCKPIPLAEAPARVVRAAAPYLDQLVHDLCDVAENEITTIEAVRTRLEHCSGAAKTRPSAEINGPSRSKRSTSL